MNPWWWLRSQPSAPDELNEPDDVHPVRVPTRLDHHGDADEAVWARREAADQWNARVWRTRP